jgi:hypothetical protein
MSLQEKGKFITRILSISHKDAKELSFLCTHSTNTNNAKINSAFVILQSRINMLLTYISESWEYNYSRLLTQVVPALTVKFANDNFTKEAVDKHLVEFSNGQPKVLLLYTRLLIAKDMLEAIGKDVVNNRFEELVREVKFPPEYQQAGISLLNYFSVILEKTLPNTDIPISVEQSKDKVIMTLKLPEGAKDKVIELLATYGKVIKGEMRPEDILKNPNDILAFKYKKDIAEMEVRHTKELLYSERAHTSQRIEFLESEVTKLYKIVADNLSSTQNMAHNLLALLKSNISNDDKNVATLIDALIRTAEQKDEATAQEILVTLQREEPWVYEKFKELIIKGAIAGASGNYLYSWLQALMISLPK